MARNRKPPESIPPKRPPRFNPEINKLPVTFSSRHVIKRGKFGCSSLEKQDKERLKNKLAEYSRLSLEQFSSSGGPDLKEWEGTVPGKKPTGLSQDILDGPIMRFRVSQKMRVLGYLQDNIFHVVWIDPNHKIKGKGR